MKTDMLHDIDAEKSVLGAVLLDRKCMADVAPEITVSDFHHPAHAVIWEAMLELERSSSPIDTVSVPDALRSAGTFDRLNSLGGADYLVDLLASVVTISSVGFHARVIARKADRRRWVKACIELREKGISECSDEEFTQEAERTLMTLTSRKRTGGPEAVKKVLGRVVKTLETRYERRNERAITGIASGLHSLDAFTSGWQKSDLIVIAGRPSMGKTSMAMTTAVEAARAGVPVLVFSLEMSADALVERVVAMEGNLDSSQLRTGKIETKTWIRLSSSWGRVAEMPLWIDDQSSLTIGEIRARARRWRLNEASKAETVLVVVDYIGLVHPDVSHHVREREVAQVSAGLKAMAKDMASPVIALSQLNRSLESRTDKRPMMSDLRESGAIEQDSDVIAFLYRDEVYHDTPPAGQCKHCGPGVAEIIVAKQRNGATGCAHVGWRAVSTKFVNLGTRSEWTDVSRPNGQNGSILGGD